MNYCIKSQLLCYESVRYYLISNAKYMYIGRFTKSIARCKSAVSPLLTHWRYCSVVPSHRDDNYLIEMLNEAFREQQHPSLWDHRSVNGEPNCWAHSLETGTVRHRPIIWSMYLTHEQSHMRQFGIWQWRCTNSATDNSIELRMEKICPAVLKMCVPQANPCEANGQMTIALHNYESRQFHRIWNGWNPSNGLRYMR